MVNLSKVICVCCVIGWDLDAQPPMDDLPSEGSHSRKSPPEGDRAGRGGAGSDRDRGPAGEAIINMPLPLPIPEIHSVGGVLVHMPHVCSCIYTICLLLAFPS